MSRNASLVELVDQGGAPVGVTTVGHAHEWPGVLHRAFSVLLIDPDGRLLVQRRAAAKNRFALRWANACCGHPAPGENVIEAAARRVGEELGLRPDGLEPLGVYVYRAADPTTSRVEHEYDHVLVGHVGAASRLSPDPAEVADLRWMDVAALRDDLRTNPARYAPWLAGVVELWDSGTLSTAEPPVGQ
jgi:isopentenyl-diphosphate delta-isomerase